MEHSSPGLFCSDLSLEADEPLAGTVTRTSTYLLLESSDAPGKKAIEDSLVPDELKSKLKAYTKVNPTCKALLIRSPRSRLQPGIRFFVARAEPPTSLYDFHVSDYRDLLEVDFSEVVAGSPMYEDYRREAHLYLVCTNGRRDRCCARYGPAVYSEMMNIVGNQPEIEVWQSSHVGGHRFAANVIYLPDGIWYGRMRPDDVPGMLAAHRDGHLYLPRLRGRGLYSPVVQAAEAALLVAGGQRKGMEAHLIAADETAPGQWKIVFDAADGRRFSLRAVARLDDRRVYESCLLDKDTAITRYSFEILEN